jgi:hypothetical protein
MPGAKLFLERMEEQEVYGNLSGQIDHGAVVWFGL